MAEYHVYGVYGFGVHCCGATGCGERWCGLCESDACRSITYMVHMGAVYSALVELVAAHDGMVYVSVAHVVVSCIW